MQIDLFGEQGNAVADVLSELLAEDGLSHEVAVFGFADLGGVEELAVAFGVFAFDLRGGLAERFGLGGGQDEADLVVHFLSGYGYAHAGGGLGDNLVFDYDLERLEDVIGGSEFLCSGEFHRFLAEPQ